MERGEIRNPIMVLLLSIFTCGMYGIIWFVALCDDLNKGLGRQEFHPGKELLLSIVTCGLWGVYLGSRLSDATVEVQRSWGVQPTMDASNLFLLTLLGMGPFFIQRGLNNAWENGTSGGIDAPY